LNDEEARDIELTAANNLVLVGNTYKTPTDRDLMIMTLTLDGVKLDSNSFQVRDSLGIVRVGDEDVATVTELPDGFLISGSSTVVNVPNPANTHDAMKVRVYSNLQEYDLSWVQLIGFKLADDVSYKIIPASLSGFGSYYLFGFTNQLPPSQTQVSYNFIFYVLGSTGQPFSDPTYVGATSANERMSGFAFTPAGYLLSGVSTNNAGACDLYLVDTGIPDILLGWPFNLDQTLSLNLGSNLTGRTSVMRSSSGDYYLLGEERSFDDNQNWVLTKVKNNGNVAWSSPMVYGGQGLDECGAITELADARLMIIGTMRTGRPDAGEYKMTLIKVNMDGKFE